jgi:hypothetical protein
MGVQLLLSPLPPFPQLGLVSWHFGLLHTGLLSLEVGLSGNVPA